MIKIYIEGVNKRRNTGGILYKNYVLPFNILTGETYELLKFTDIQYNNLRELPILSILKTKKGVEILYLNDLNVELKNTYSLDSFNKILKTLVRGSYVLYTIIEDEKEIEGVVYTQIYLVLSGNLKDQQIRGLLK